MPFVVKIIKSDELLCILIRLGLMGMCTMRIIGMTHGDMQDEHTLYPLHMRKITTNSSQTPYVPHDSRCWVVKNPHNHSPKGFKDQDDC